MVNQEMITKTEQSDAAHHLHYGLAIHYHMLESTPVSVSHMAGTNNTLLADITSQAITHQLDSNYVFLTHFDSFFFPFQNRYCLATCHPGPHLHSTITSPAIMLTTIDNPNKNRHHHGAIAIAQ